MKKAIMVIASMLVALAGWSEGEVSYQGIVPGTAWEDIPFLEDMEDRTEWLDEGVPGRAYQRFTEVLDYPAEEIWYGSEDKVQMICITLDSELYDKVLDILEYRYGPSWSPKPNEYSMIKGQGAVWLGYPDGELVLIYMTLEMFEVVCALGKEELDAPGL